MTTYDGHHRDDDVGEAHPDAHPFGIGAKAVVAAQGDDTAPTRAQYHAGLQYRCAQRWPNALPANNRGMQIVQQTLPANLFMYYQIDEDRQEESKHQHTGTTQRLTNLRIKKEYSFRDLNQVIN